MCDASAYNRLVIQRQLMVSVFQEERVGADVQHREWTETLETILPRSALLYSKGAVRREISYVDTPTTFIFMRSAIQVRSTFDQ